jgi:hypothetical protein
MAYRMQICIGLLTAVRRWHAPLAVNDNNVNKKPPAETGGGVVLRRATPRAFAQRAKQGLACQPSTFTVTVVALWALGALTVSKPPW